MNNYSFLNEEDLAFLEDIKNCAKSQIDFRLSYNSCSFLIEPIGEEIEVWQFGNKLGSYKTLDCFLNEFLLDGKPFIERIANVDFA